MEKHIIFDLDGTLIDSKQEIMDTHRQVFLQIPPPLPVNMESINFGATLQSILEEVYQNNQALIASAKVKFADIYDHSSFNQTLLYPSAEEVLEFLHGQRFVLHIATNKRLIPTLNILSKKQISDYFKSVKASDMMAGQVMSKTEMVAQICRENKIQSGYMIGDSIQDIEAGQASDLSTIAVTYGYEKKEHLTKKNPTFVIHKLSELYNIVKEEI